MFRKVSAAVVADHTKDNPFTCYTSTDLITMRWRATGKRASLKFLRWEVDALERFDKERDRRVTHRL